MKTTILILACVFQNVSRIVLCSEIIESDKIETDFTREFPSPAGVGSFDPSGPSSQNARLEASPTSKLVAHALDSPSEIDYPFVVPSEYVFSDRTEIGSFTPINHLISENDVKDSFLLRMLPRISSIGSSISDSGSEYSTSYSSSFSSSSSDSDSDLSESSIWKTRLTETPVQRLDKSVIYLEVDSDDSDYEGCDHHKNRIINDSLKHYENDGSIFIKESENPKVETDEEDEVIRLSDYKTVDDISDLPLLERSRLYFALSTQLLDSMDFKSAVKLSEIPAVLFLLKASLKIRRIRGTLLTGDEMKNGRLMIKAIADLKDKMVIEDILEIVEYLYRAKRDFPANELLGDFIVPFMYRLNPKKNDKLSVCAHFLHGLACHGRTRIMSVLLTNDITGPFLRKRIVSDEISSILQTVLNDGWTSDSEAIEISKLLLLSRAMSTFNRKHGSHIVMNLEGKRNPETLSFFDE